MKQIFTIFLVWLAVISFAGCKSPATGDFQTSGSSGNQKTSSDTSSKNEGLTDSKVETAVNSMLSDWRLGGNVSVRGVQELPQQNAAVADLTFNDFQYGTTFEGGLVKAADFKPKPMPQGINRMPAMDEMFPQRKVVYSKDGKAILSRYTDGRWVLKEVRWGFDTGVKGTVEIR